MASTVADYTPTTEGVRDAYRGEWVAAGRAAEFDRWYAAEKAKWQAEAWDEGRAVGYADGNGGESAFRQTNPYKED